MSGTDSFRRYISTIKAESTADRYAVAADKFLGWLRSQGIRRLHDAPKPVLMQYCAFLSEEGYMPATVHMHMAGVNRYIRWAQTQDADIPSFHKAELPKNPRKMRDILGPEELSQFFKLADDHLREPVRSAVMLLPCSGLRGNELSGLRLNCLRRVPVKAEGGGTVEVLAVVVHGKGGNERVVPLLNEGAQIIAQYMRGWRRTHSDTQWMFPGRGEDAHLTARALRSALQRIREPLGLTFTPHTMRRTHLTGLYRRGVAVEMLAKLAGHKKVDTTIKHYLALDSQDVAGAVHAVGATLL